MPEAMDQMKEISIQEELLRFDTFSCERALELGLYMVEKMRSLRVSLAISIRMNGHVLFHYSSEGTSPCNNSWMRRKANMVDYFNKSSLYMRYKMIEQDFSLQTFNLSTGDYCTVGGGFPLAIKNVGVVGSIVVSGLPHVEDHKFIVTCLSEYLNIKINF